MDTLLVVDGYNVINAFVGSSLIDSTDMDRARFQLLNLLVSCTCFWGHRLIVVFDALHVPGGVEREERISQHASVIFTAQGVSADTVIERIIADSASHQPVIVATSDGAEQSYAFGKGAIRWPARELLNRIRSAREHIERQSAMGNQQIPLSRQLDARVVEEFNQMRLRPMPHNKKQKGR